MTRRDFLAASAAALAAAPSLVLAAPSLSPVPRAVPWSDVEAAMDAIRAALVGWAPPGVDPGRVWWHVSYDHERRDIRSEFSAWSDDLDCLIHSYTLYGPASVPHDPRDHAATGRLVRGLFDDMHAYKIERRRTREG